jgi:hypothetical protein
MLLGMNFNGGLKALVLVCLAMAMLLGCGHGQEVSGPGAQAVLACRVEPKEDELIGKGADGNVVWTRHVKGVSYGYSNRQMAKDGERVYAATDAGMIAVEIGNGKLVWESMEGVYDLKLIGDVLVTLMDRSEDVEAVEEYWLVAYRAKTGEKVFETRLPEDLAYFQNRLESLRISEMTGMYLVQGVHEIRGTGYAVLVDRQGKVWHRSYRRILDGVQVGESRLLVTSKSVVCLWASGQTKWERMFEWRENGGRMLKGADGTLLAYLYGPISDSGVQVMRIRIEDGMVLWQVYCDPLGTTHSAYGHDADVTCDDKTVMVRSAGSSGSWVEVLDVQSGKRVSRGERERAVDLTGRVNAKWVVP